MADNIDTNPPDSAAPAIKKRRLRSSSTETVRQRALRLSGQDQRTDTPAEPSKEPGALRAFWRGFVWPLRQMWRGLRFVGRIRIIRFAGRLLFPRYFRNSWRELRLVTWPNRRQSWALTYAVIVFSVIFGAIIAGVDYGLDKLFKELIIK